MYSLRIEMYSVTRYTDHMPECNRIEKEYYPSLTEYQTSLILSAWSDMDDILEEWVKSGKGDYKKVVDEPDKYRFIVEVYKNENSIL